MSLYSDSGPYLLSLYANSITKKQEAYWPPVFFSGEY